MARKPSARVVLNRAALDQVHLALADGVEEIARTIVETAGPPDATPFGLGLVNSGGWAVYDGKKKLSGGSLDGSQPKKPRAFRAEATGITGIAGFGFPARFQETGTVHQPARPFLLPAAIRVKGIAAAIMRDVVGPHLAGRR
jgi:hypothetical protein